MKVEIDKLVCDECEKFIEINKSEIKFGPPLKSNWINIRRNHRSENVDFGSNKSFDYCSLNCAIKSLQKLVEIK